MSDKLKRPKELANRLYKEYSLDKEVDFFKHKKGHYLIVTKSGIDKIIDKASIEIEYEVISCHPEYAAIKATGVMKHETEEAKTVTTFASAKYGGKEKVGDKWVSQGTTDQWYVLEMAEKRVNSRVVLRLLEMYDAVKGEDESEEFQERLSDDVNKKGDDANAIALNKASGN